MLKSTLPCARIQEVAEQPVDRPRGTPTAEPVSAPQGGYRPDIDGLRAVAVVAVILNHIDHRLLPGGYLGVDVFFVISGFVITLSLHQHRGANLVALLASFYARRCRRLLPALAVCALASGLLAWLLDPFPLISLKTGVTALFGFSNIALLVVSQDYFAPSSQLNMFMQTWSLAVEEQFYVFFPALVWLSGLGRTSAGPSRLLRLCLLLSAISIAILFVLPGHRGGAAYFLPFGRLWELLTGCTAALFSLTHPGLAMALRKPALSWVAGALLLAAFAAPIPPTVLASLLVVPPTALLILAGPAAGRVPWLLSSRPFVAVGQMSYSLYLWHWPVVSGSLLMFGRYHGQMPISLALTLALGAASYIWVERPARLLLTARRMSWSYAFAAVSVASVSGILLALCLVQNSAPLATRRFQEFPPAFIPFPVTAADYMRECVVAPPDRPLKPTSFERCTAQPGRAGQPTFWAMGDSHAGHLLGLLAELQRQQGAGVHLVETPGNAFPLPPGTVLAERERLFQATLQRIKPGDVLLLGRLFLTRDDPIAPWPGLDTWIKEVQVLANRMRPFGVQVVVVGPPPMFQFPAIYTCSLQSGGGTSCDVARAGLAMVIDPIEKALKDAAADHPNLHIFSSFSVLCPPSAMTCSPVKGQIPQYRDRDHLNSVGAGSLAPDFLHWLNQRRSDGSLD